LAEGIADFRLTNTPNYEKIRIKDLIVLYRRKGGLITIMGLLSSLFAGRAQDAPEEAPVREPEKKESTSEFPSLRSGMELDISRQDGQPLLSGKITDVSPAGVTLERKPGQFAFEVCELGATVYIRGYNPDATPFDLKGIVEEASRIRYRIKDLSKVSHSEHRNNFRLFMSAPVTLYYEEDEHFQNPENCELVNISAGGACVQSEYIHGDGEILRLKVQIDDYTPMTFLCQVIRVDEPKPNIFRYGLLFAQLTDQETSALTRMLFNIQTGNKKLHMRVQYGHW